MSSLLSIHQILISVFNKSKILNFAKTLSLHGAQILSTEGTAQTLSNHGVLAQTISEYTQFPEIMNGRVKTLHHKIYAGILNRIGLDDNILNKYHIHPIDMIIVDFYPFNQISQNNKYSQEDILEYIDIGGPSMVRAAAKNYKNTVIIVDHYDYDNIANEMNKYNGSISLNTRFTLAVKAFKYITEYDIAISNYFNNKLKIHTNSNSKYTNTNKQSSFNYNFPDTLKCMHINFKKKQDMRYGENPHQEAALYQDTHTLQTTTGSVVTAQQLQGKPLSYNNIIDLDTALECVKAFTEPTCVIVKHANPCGVATSNTITEAYKKAYQADTISAFGGIIALNRDLDALTAQTIIDQHFIEAIIAPNIHHDCLTIFSHKKHIRILCSGLWNTHNNPDIDFKRITGGLLVQNRNIATYPKHLNIVTIIQPNPEEIQDALFCWKIVKFVKSNAIVCAKNQQTTGIGAGQMNRVNAVKIATTYSKKHHNHQLPGSSMASDAFFPFPDAIHIAAKIGIRCIIQPGGSIKDSEIIEAANKHGISMIFTHIRHFRH